MELESQSVINPCHKSCPIKPDQPSIAWIKFIMPSSSFGPSLECPALESTQISWISALSASLIFLDLALVIGPTGTCNGSLNACWFSSKTKNHVNLNKKHLRWRIKINLLMQIPKTPRLKTSKFIESPNSTSKPNQIQ